MLFTVHLSLHVAMQKHVNVKFSVNISETFLHIRHSKVIIPIHVSSPKAILIPIPSHTTAIVVVVVVVVVERTD